MRRRSKKNPWRNTRNDFKMPWNRIYGVMVIIAVPVMLVTLVPNLVLRSGTFYSYFLSKTGIVKEIPYAIEMEDVRDTFRNFMWHRMSGFNLMEKEGYMPQQVFTSSDNVIMGFMRTSADIMAVIGIIALILFLVAAIRLYINKKNDFLYDKFKISLIVAAVFTAVNSLIIFVPEIRTGIFRGYFGNRFPPGDVLIQIFDAGFPVYYAGGVIVVTIVAGAGLIYLMKKFVGSRNLF